MYREDTDENPIPTPESLHFLWIAPEDAKTRTRREKIERFRRRFDAAAIEAIKEGRKTFRVWFPPFKSAGDTLCSQGKFRERGWFIYDKTKFFGLYVVGVIISKAGIGFRYPTLRWH